jgi:addiction module RelE/StbE family toxin
MDFRVIFSKQAIRDLTAITKLVAHNDPNAARELGDRLVASALSLRSFPLRHVKYPLRHGTRKMPVSPYVIYYVVDEAARVVTIRHFWHGSRQPPIL